jgi:hypothetical protein
MSDVYDRWGHKKLNIEFDEFKDLISKVNAEHIKYALRQRYDTDDPIYVAKTILAELDIHVTKLSYEDEDGNLISFSRKEHDE